MLGRLALHTKLSYRTNSIIRCLFGVMFALLFATVNNVMSPQIAAIFTILFLDKGKNALGLKKSIGIIIGIYGLGLAGLVLGSFVQDFMVITLLLVGLVIFWSFKLVIIPVPVRMLFLSLTLLFPFLSLTAEPLGGLVLMDMTLNLAIALVATQLAFFIFPETATITPPVVANNELTEKFNLDKIALNGVLVIMPAVLYFYFFRPNTMVITFAHIMMLALDPLIYKSKKSLVYIVANFFGGLAAVFAYNLLTVTPTFFFYIFLLLAFGVYFVYQMFSDKKTVAIYAMAYRTFFVVMGVIVTSSDTAGDKVLDRLIGILIAIVYVVLAYKIISYFNDPEIHETEKI